MKLSKLNLPNHLSKYSLYGIIFSLVISITSIVAYFSIRPKINNGNLQIAGYLTDKKSRISRQTADSLSFYDIDKNQPIYFGDEIFTYENSSALITLHPSNNKLQLSPKTLVRIEQKNEDPTLEIKDGQLKLVLQPNSKISMTKNSITTQIKNDSNKVAEAETYLSDGQMAVTSNSDNISIGNEKQNHKLNKNESANIDQESIKKSSFNLTSPNNHQIVSSEENLKIKWESKNPIKIFIATDLSFNNLVYQFQSINEQSELLVPMLLPEGQYFLKLTNINEDEKKIIQFKTLQKYQINLISPKNNEKIIFDRLHNKIKFSWEAVENKEFKITFNEGTTDEKSFETKDNFFEYEPNQEKDISWNIKVKLNNGEYSKPKVTYNLEIEYTKKNVLISPTLNNTSFYTNQGPINFEWASFKDEEFQVTIKNSVDKNPAILEKMKENKIAFTPKENGSYVFNLKSITHPDFTEINFPFTVFTRVATPKTKLDEVSDNKTQQKTLHFEFEKNPNFNGELLFEVSKYSNFNELLDSKPLVNNQIDYPIGNSIQYCFRVNGVSNNSLFVPSEPQCTFINDPSKIKIDPPKSIVISRHGLWHLDPCVLEAPLIDIATEYEFNVYEDKELKKEIFSGKSKTNKLVLFNEDIGVLEYRKANISGGEFYYTYRIITSKGLSSNFSESAEIKLPKTIFINVMIIITSMIGIYFIILNLLKIKSVRAKINQLFGPK